MATPTHHSTKFEKTAHYSVLGQANDKVRYLWIVCHGYGQLASQIIHKFSSVYTAEHLFIAPEGLSRFYWDQTKGIVGSSWMTKKDRLDEIADYCNFIQNLHDKHIPYCHPDVKVIAFGFSQGVATVFRWMMEKKPMLKSLIMWAGMTPEDLDYRSQHEYLSKIDFYSIHGTQDRFLTKERINFQKNLEQEQGLDIKHFQFEGKHVIEREILVNLFTKFL